jgi:predicted phosphodiesterase
MRSLADDAAIRVAIISDVHGNRWALEAVLADIAERDVTRIVNLGDCLYGPLDPAGTARILMSYVIHSVRGNEDRLILELERDRLMDPTVEYVRGELGVRELAWLGSLPRTLEVGDDLFLCHGTPADDTEYLMRTVGPDGVWARRPEEIEGLLAAVDGAVILCGHDHLQAEMRLPGGSLVVNPGSVGLQAFVDDYPFPHRIETGSPHACYTILTGGGESRQVERRRVPYDWESAAEAAARRDRPDWAHALRTGRAA